MVEAAAIAKTQSEYVKVERTKLLETIRKNAETHQEEWKTAHDKWHEEQIEKQIEYQKAMAGCIDKAQSDGEITWPNYHEFMLEEPQSHKKQYDRVICRLDMSVDEHIFLSHKDFDRYVMDDWEWKAGFTRSVSNYNKK